MNFALWFLQIHIHNRHAVGNSWIQNIDLLFIIIHINIDSWIFCLAINIIHFLKFINDLQNCLLLLHDFLLQVLLLSISFHVDGILLFLVHLELVQSHAQLHSYQFILVVYILEFLLIFWEFGELVRVDWRSHLFFLSLYDFTSQIVWSLQLLLVFWLLCFGFLLCSLPGCLLLLLL